MAGLGIGSYKDREYADLTLSDRNVVKYLILYRSKVDVSYNVNNNIDIKQAGDIFEFNQELIALYSSLDITIGKCNFKEKQLTLLRFIFEGNTIHDVCNMNIGYTRSATYELFNRMLDRILLENYKLWANSMKSQGYIKE